MSGRGPAGRRSSVLVLVGLVVFVIGAAGALFLSRSGGGHPTRVIAAAPPTTTTLARPAAGSGAAAAPPGAASLHIPPGQVAVAVQMGTTAAVGGYPATGDRVDVLGAFSKDQPAGTPLKVPLVKLVLADVKVLAVHGPLPSASPGTTVLVLAVSPAQAEKVVYLASFEHLYTALAPAHQPAPTTGGASGANVLARS
ncbi:MAG: RcpC/CpaB family pilus assembly protein [Acidimicrobiales bacterium]